MRQDWEHWWDGVGGGHPRESGLGLSLQAARSYMSEDQSEESS